MTFEVLASGSGGNAYVVREEGVAPLLLEAGIKYARLNRELKFKLQDFAGALISHSHLDHSEAGPALAQQAVPVWALPETIESMRPGGHHHMHAIPLLEWFDVGPWQVQAFDVIHDVPNAGFQIDSPSGERLVYVTDTPFVKYRFENVTIAAVEANYSRAVVDGLVRSERINVGHAARVVRNHMSIEQATALLDALKGPRLREVHLLHLSASNSDASAFKAAVERVVGVPAYIAPERRSVTA